MSTQPQKQSPYLKLTFLNNFTNSFLSLAALPDGPDELGN